MIPTHNDCLLPLGIVDYEKGQLWILDAHFMEGWFVEIFMTIPHPHSSTLCSDDQASNARGGKGQVILSVCRSEGVFA